MILLFYYILLLSYVVLNKDKSIARLLIILQIISLSGIFLIDADYEINSLFKVFNLLFTVVVMSIIILPWRNIVGIAGISVHDEIKLKRLTYTIMGISIIPFIIFSTVSAFVLIYVDDINNFKYAENVAEDFYYSLPINKYLLIASINIYEVSYFLIPLHFYYLSKRQFKLSLACFVLSLTLPLHGLMFFSRASFVSYFMLYISMLYILYGTLDYSTRINIKRFSIVSLLGLTSYFLYISDSRFVGDVSYAETIPSTSFLQNPVLYSYFDYLSQSYRNGMHVLNLYNFETFTGLVSLQSLFGLMSHFGILNFNPAELMVMRQKLWPDNWYTFNGLVAYSVYDYGYFLTIVFSLIYLHIILKMKVINRRISIVDLFILVLLIQIPLASIFYSVVSGLIFSFAFLMIITIYLKMKV